MGDVTLVTRGAGSADKLSDKDYRDIYDELRSKCGLRQFAETIRSAVSFGWWAKYERGEALLTRDRKAELRAAVGLPALPLTIGEVAAGVDPDATVWQVGDGRPDRVVLVGAEAHEPIEMRLNGNLQILGAERSQDAHVTPVTWHRRRVTTKAVRFSPEQWKRLSALRKEAGMTWDEFADWVATLCGA